MATSADVPGTYDVVVNGVGFVCASSEQVQGTFGYTPTFVPRSNTQGDYGDNQQDFWLTATQRDWSRGEGRRHFSQQESAAEYWTGANVDVTVPGQVTIRPGTSTTVAAAAALITCAQTDRTEISALTSTNLYTLSGSATFANQGAHGLAFAPVRFAITEGGGALRVFSDGATVRQWNGTAFSQFSATGAYALEFLNNSLYGIDGSGNLRRYDTAGTATSVYSWRSMSGATPNTTESMLRAYGSKLLVLHQSLGRGGELWLYDGVGATRVHVFGPDFQPYDIAVQNGVVFIGGYEKRLSTANATVVRPAVYFWANGTVGRLWRASTYLTQSTSIAYTAVTPFEGGVVWNDDTTGNFCYYDPETGGVSTIFTYTVAGTFPIIASAGGLLVMTRNQTTATRYPNNDSIASTATVTTSLFDLNSSLTKLFRGITVDWQAATDGNGGTVDIAYRVGDVDGAYTTLQTGAVSGTEYSLSGISGRSISVKVTLNKGTSTAGPVLKRIYVRGVPIQFTYKRGTQILLCTGRDGLNHVQLRNGSTEPLDGLALATRLRTAATSTSPIAITDQFGTISNAVIENDGFDLRQIRPNEFLAVVPYREV